MIFSIEVSDVVIYPLLSRYTIAGSPGDNTGNTIYEKRPEEILVLIRLKSCFKIAQNSFHFPKQVLQIQKKKKKNFEKKIKKKKKKVLQIRF